MDVQEQIDFAAKALREGCKDIINKPVTEESRQVLVGNIKNVLKDLEQKGVLPAWDVRVSADKDDPTLYHIEVDVPPYMKETMDELFRGIKADRVAGGEE